MKALPIMRRYLRMAAKAAKSRKSEPGDQAGLTLFSRDPLWSQSLSIAKNEGPETWQQDPRYQDAEDLCLGKILDYLYDHPGALRLVDGCYHYTDDYRRYAMSLRDPGEPGRDLSIEDFAKVVRLPLEIVDPVRLNVASVQD